MHEKVLWQYLIVITTVCYLAVKPNKDVLNDETDIQYACYAGKIEKIQCTEGKNKHNRLYHVHIPVQNSPFQL